MYKGSCYVVKELYLKIGGNSVAQSCE